VFVCFTSEHGDLAAVTDGVTPANTGWFLTNERVHLPLQVIVDYAQSEDKLKESRDKDELSIPVFLTGDDIIASKANTMRGTLDHLQKKYKGIENYARKIGLSTEEVAAIRRNLTRPAETPDDPAADANVVAPVEE
jgi:Tyrosine phosphatase family